MADLSDKTRIPLAWAVTIVVTLLGLLASLGGVAMAHGTDQQRLSTVEAEVKKYETDRERLIRMEEQATQTRSAVERIERKLDRRTP